MKKNSYMAFALGISFGTIFGAVALIAVLDVMFKKGEQTRLEVRANELHVKHVKQLKCMQDADFVKVVGENRDMGVTLEKHLDQVSPEARDLIVWTYVNAHVPGRDLRISYQMECERKI